MVEPHEKGFAVVAGYDSEEQNDKIWIERNIYRGEKTVETNGDTKGGMSEVERKPTMDLGTAVGKDEDLGIIESKMTKEQTFLPVKGSQQILENPGSETTASATASITASEPPSLAPGDDSSPAAADPASDSELSELEDDDDSEFDFDYQNTGTGKVLVIKPTKEQWTQFPAILDFARSHGAEDDGCFKLVLPDSLREAAEQPRKPSQKLQANSYKVKQKRDRRAWQVSTIPVDGDFQRQTTTTTAATKSVTEITRNESMTETTRDESVKTLRSLLSKYNGVNRPLRNVRYRADVPAWTAEQRQKAGVPTDSPIHPLAGDKLERTTTRVPGIHTPYVYESADHFGAMFQIHAEDYRLLSLNHLYVGRKIWIVTPCTAIDKVEQKLLGKTPKQCSQFMRHRAEFLLPHQLDKLGIEYRVVDQRAGETIVILPDAYHEGFSTGYTLAEAKNYADDAWDTDGYMPCDEGCNFPVAIPMDHMLLMSEPGQVQVDLCAEYDDENGWDYDSSMGDVASKNCKVEQDGMSSEKDARLTADKDSMVDEPGARLKYDKDGMSDEPEAKRRKVQDVV